MGGSPCLGGGVPGRSSARAGGGLLLGRVLALGGLGLVLGGLGLVRPGVGLARRGEEGGQFRDPGAEGGDPRLGPGLACLAGHPALAGVAAPDLEEILGGAFPFGPALAEDDDSGEPLPVGGPCGDPEDREEGGGGLGDGQEGGVGREDAGLAGHGVSPVVSGGDPVRASARSRRPRTAPRRSRRASAVRGAI